tara:strand:- start:483 stop:647 length:165 start_codon:yes stop_codon:yes gene_type:complete
MSKWLCNECLSDDIKINKDKQKEMSCFCNKCKEENYIVSSWWISRNKKGVNTNV